MEGSGRGSAFAETVLVWCKRDLIAEWLEHNALEDFGRGQQQRDGVEACALILWLVGFQDWDDSTYSPGWLDDGLVHHVVVDVGEVGECGWTRLLEHDGGNVIWAKCFRVFAFLNGFDRLLDGDGDCQLVRRLFDVSVGLPEGLGCLGRSYFAGVKVVI